MGLRDADVFAELVRALEPYLEEIVFIGGWVHALHLHEADPTLEPVRTTDVDISLPRELHPRGRPPLLDLIRTAGFETEKIDDASGLLLVRRGDVDLDLLCDVEDPTEIVSVGGQDGLAVQGFPFLDMLLTASRMVSIGPEVHESLDPPRTIRIPTLPAYTLGKILSARSRTTFRRRTKDLVYLYQILTQQSLRETLLAMLPGHLRDYPEAAYSASEALSGFVNQTTVRRDVAAQLLELDMVPEGQDPLADFTAHLRRFQHEIDLILAEP